MYFEQFYQNQSLSLKFHNYRSAKFYITLNKIHTQNSTRMRLSSDPSTALYIPYAWNALSTYKINPTKTAFKLLHFVHKRCLQHNV